MANGEADEQLAAVVKAAVSRHTFSPHTLVRHSRRDIRDRHLGEDEDPVHRSGCVQCQTAATLDEFGDHVFWCVATNVYEATAARGSQAATEGKAPDRTSSVVDELDQQLHELEGATARLQGAIAFLQAEWQKAAARLNSIRARVESSTNHFGELALKFECQDGDSVTDAFREARANLADWTAVEKAACHHLKRIDETKQKSLADLAHARACEEKTRFERRLAIVRSEQDSVFLLTKDLLHAQNQSSCVVL